MRHRKPGFIIHRDPDTVRTATWLLTICAGRMPKELPRGYFEGSRTWLSRSYRPRDRPGEVRHKIKDWLEAGCRAVWIVDPRTRSVTVHKSAGETAEFSAADTLVDAQGLPGFTLAVSEVFG